MKPTRVKSTMVLVMEEPTVRALAESIIERLGYMILSAAREAIALFQQDEPIDILFTDINLPDGRDTIDGLELARKATDAAGRWAICVPLTRGDKIVVPPHIPQSVIISAESIFGFLDCVIEEPLARPIESKLKGEAVARRQM